MEHRRFRDLPELIPRGDALVLNTTKVFRARLLGKRASGADAEILLLHEIGGGKWEKHLGHSESLFVNASTFGLMLTGRTARFLRHDPSDPDWQGRDRFDELRRQQRGNVRWMLLRKANTGRTLRPLIRSISSSCS